MSRKRAEVELRELVKYHGFYWYKFGDVRYCVHCGKPLPKSELKPDFVVAPIATYVECKNSDASGRWNWTEIGPEGARKNQRDWLNDHGGWLFIELGTGRAPGGKCAWLVPWNIWIEQIEPRLEVTGQRSIKMKTDYNQDGTVTRGMLGGDYLFNGYELAWMPKQGWYIPDRHVFWEALARSARRMLYVAEKKQ